MRYRAMDYHKKGMRLSERAREAGGNTPHTRRLVRRMLRLWARGWAQHGDIEHARVILRDVKNLR
jgi:hypothetical protein